MVLNLTKTSFMMNELLYYEDRRVGNFKVAKVKLLLDDKGHARVENNGANVKQKFLEKNGYSEIDALKVCSLEETWSVRIPSTFSMYGILLALVESGEEKDMRIAFSLLQNFYACTSIPDGKYQNGLLQYTAEYVKGLKGDGADLTEEEYDKAEMAEAMRDVLEKSEEGNTDGEYSVVS